MPIDADALADRRHLKRRLTLWRFAAVGALGLALLILTMQNQTGFHGAQIARVEINGIILDDRPMQDLLEKLRDDSGIKAVILSIDSPGGTTTGSEALYESVRNLAEKKPVVAVLGTVAASGGYIAALSADHVVARGNTLTGSIGVLFQWTQLSGLMEKLGLEARSVKSAPLKAEPNPFSKPSPEALAVTQELITSSYDWFLALVVERRKLDPKTARKLGDGRVYTGFQAVENGLVDEIGGEEQAVAWLEDVRKVKGDLPVETWKPKRPEDQLGFLAARAFGEGFARGIVSLGGKTLQTKTLTLDGLTSVWQADAQ
ncbi:MAG: signal peptide peptidase SppA [Parvibaculum sp.]|nr:signal peptide peptidase SppA [Parvibaculum sp.]